MGVRVHLYVDFDHVDDAQWSGFCDEVLKVIEAYPDPVLGRIESIDVCGVQTVAYTPTVEGEIDGVPHIFVCGDGRSRLAGERYELRRTIAKWRRESEPESLLVKMAREQDVRRDMFDHAKTQGAPYHVLVVAIATLAENRLWPHAIAAGDIDPAQGRRAVGVLKGALGSEFQRPIVTDKARFEEHLASASLDDDAISWARSMFLQGTASSVIGDFLGILEQDPRVQIRMDLDERLPGVQDVGQLRAPTLLLLDDLAQNLATLFRKAELQRRDSILTCSDRDELLRDLARTTDRKVWFTWLGWEELRAARLEHLQFCAATLRALDLESWERHKLARGLLDNERVRKYVFDRWRAAMAEPLPEE